MSHLMATLFEGVPSLVAPECEPVLAGCLAAAMADPQARELLAVQASAEAGYWPEPGHWLNAYRPYVVVDGVLQIPVKGALLSGLSIAWGNYATGYPYIRRAFDRGLADGNVRGIALICDTPGGEVRDCFDLADHIYASRGRKPIRAFAADAAYSAGYALASAADRIVVSRTGGVGSIGVVRAHRDYSGQAEQRGIRTTFIFFGEHKVDGNSEQPLPEAVRQRMQDRVDELGAEFVATVARNRDLSEDAVRATKALTFTAGAALENRLADAIGSLDAAVAIFATDLTSSATEDTMTAITQEAHEAALASARTNAAAEAATAASAAATGRVTAILADPRSKGRERAALQLAASSPSMDVEAVLAFVAEHAGAPAAGGGRLDALVPDPQVAPDGSGNGAPAAYDPGASLALAVTAAIGTR